MATRRRRPATCAGGTAAYRFTGEGRGGKEGLERIVKVFPQWYIPGLAEFAGQVEKLPFDAHSLIALHAPRPLLNEDGTDDPSVNLPAVEQSYRAAKPVYALLGAADRLGIFARPGGHPLQAEDWGIVLDFADRELRGKTVARQFDQLPAPGDAPKSVGHSVGPLVLTSLTALVSFSSCGGCTQAGNSARGSLLPAWFPSDPRAQHAA